jgi:hypothetical protein
VAQRWLLSRDSLPRNGLRGVLSLKTEKVVNQSGGRMCSRHASAVVCLITPSEAQREFSPAVTHTICSLFSRTSTCFHRFKHPIHEFRLIHVGIPDGFKTIGVRRERQRLPSSLLIENSSAWFGSSKPQFCAPGHFRSRLTTTRPCDREQWLNDFPDRDFKGVRVPVIVRALCIQAG